MGDYFCGWYIKCQNGTHTVALIPAYHISGGVKSASVQVITDNSSWNVPYSYHDFSQNREGVQIGKNRFRRDGMTLDLHTPDLCVKGSVSFGMLTPLNYDIMGPFRYVPFMECRHSVFSMKHRVNGTLEVNGQVLCFEDGIGYIEGDRGYSFPSEYVWAQCLFPEGSVMLSAAEIPLCGFHFTGIICAIHYRGREHRIATYLGARAVIIQNGTAVICQGNKELTVRRLEDKGHPLAAPVGGNMTRTIHETAACRAYIHFREKGATVFEFESGQASFEYEYAR